MQTIQSITRSEIDSFLNTTIKVVEGYSHNQYEVIKKVHLYENGKFYSNAQKDNNTGLPLVDGDSSEDERIFFQISKPRAKAVKRFFDVDVADIILDEIDPQSELAIQLLNTDWRRFAETNRIAKPLNEMADMLTTYGTLVLKIGKKAEPKIIPLQNVICDPTVKCLKDSRFVIIKHTMTPKMLRDKVKDGWDSKAVEGIIARMAKQSKSAKAYLDDDSGDEIISSSQIEVYERYGYVPQGKIDGSKSEEEVMAVSVVAEPMLCAKIKTADGKEVIEDRGEVLYIDAWTDDVPVIDHHLYQTHGRWLGIGIIELLFPVQQRLNEVANQKRISMEISALHLFQTADPTVLNNILTDLENGDVIKTKTQGAITAIANEERNLPAFESEIVTYSSQADKLSFANDLLSGGDVPTSTPATNVVVQNNNQVLVHLQDRENFTNFLADGYIKPFVVPRLIKEMSDEHFLRITSSSDDLLQIDDRIVTIKYNQEVIKRAMAGKFTDVVLGDDLKEEIRNKLQRSGANRYTKVLKDYYKNKITDVIVIIGNEKKDMAKSANNTLSFFQLIQDPALLDDPVNRLFVENYAREVGIDTAKLQIAYAKRGNAPQAQANTKGIPDQASESQKEPAIASMQ